MAFPVIISFYTRQTPYEEEVQNLIESCEKFQLEYEVEGIDSFGSWELNCAFKPFFIMKKLEELQRPCLWVDADGIFVRTPSWQSAFEADLSVRYDLDLPSDHPSKVITSTVFAKPSAKPLIKLWMRECQIELSKEGRRVEFWDQIALRDAILRKPEGLSVAPIPLEYAKIFDHPIDEVVSNLPVIEHYQASRRFKTIIDS